MSYKIRKQFHFSAAHQLVGLPARDGVEHQCSRLHGHNYIVTLELASDVLNEHGFVRDYGDLRDFKTWLDATLDHRNLNDIVPPPSTAENIARWIAREWQARYPELVAVEVSETPATSARFEIEQSPRQ